MDNENSKLLQNLFRYYIGTTIDTNFVSYYRGVYYLWTIKKNSNRSIEITYITKSNEVPTVVEIEKNSSELIELIKKLSTYQKERKQKTEKILEEFNRLLLRHAEDPRVLSQIKKELLIYLNSGDHIEKMNYNDLEAYLKGTPSLERMLTLDDNNYIKRLAKSYIPEYFYRDFYYIQNHEVYELLRLLRINYNNDSKITGERGRTVVSSRNKKIILNDPFYFQSQIDKTIHETRKKTVKEWIPTRIVSEWDGMDHSSYYEPGHYESHEEEYEDTIKKTEPFTYHQTESMKEYCLEKSLVPRWMRKSNTLQKSNRLY